MTTLLKRAKGAKLDIVINHSDFHMFANNPPSTMALLSPHTRRISSLTLSLNRWMDVLAFSEVTSAPLPFLRTLEIRLAHHDDRFNRLTAQMLPLFSGAVNLEEFSFQPKRSASLNHFAFPTLTTLKLLILPMNRWITQELFDFLKASPTLLTVEIRVEEGGTPENIPREMAVVLPNVETLSLNVDGDGLQVYKLALHISCPRAKCTSLMQEICDFEVDTSPGVFPDPDSWKAIARQYTTSPVEEVTLEVKGPEYSSIFTYSLTFKSSDATTVSLGFRAIELDREVHVLGPSDEEMNFEIFSQACRTIRGHPQLSNLKRLHIKNSSQFFDDDDDYTTNMTEVLWGFFGSLGPLDELIMYRCDPQVFVSEIENANRAFSVVKELTLLDICMVDEERCGDAIVELARSQREMGKPFERITVHGWGIPQAMAGELRRWVGEVDCYERESFRSPSVEV